MKPQALARRWKRRYLKLEAEQWRQLRRAHTRGKTEDIHELRVTLRRLRLLLRVGRPAFDRHRFEEYLLWSRRISAETSRLRDLDVALEWLSAEKAPPAVMDSLVARRRRVWQRAKRRFVPPPLGVRRVMAGPATGHRLPPVMQRRFRKRWDQLEGAVRDRLGSFFDLPMEDRHALRRQLRNMRYLRELELSRKKQSEDPLLGRILRTQVAMGELQNLWIIRAVCQVAMPPVESRWVLRRVKTQERGLTEVISKAIRDLIET